MPLTHESNTRGTTSAARRPGRDDSPPTPPPGVEFATEHPSVTWYELDPEALCEDLPFRLWEVRNLRRTLSREYQLRPTEETRAGLFRVLDLEQGAQTALVTAQEENRAGWVSGRYANSTGLSLVQIIDLHKRRHRNR